MGEIRGGVFIVIGILITVASIVVNVMTESNFSFFIAAGAFMVVYGFFKTKGNQPMRRPYPYNQVPGQRGTINPQVKYCRRCGSPARTEEAVCQNCKGWL
ncbi:MAG: hypothetical protein ABH879_07305 [archaeon]